MAEAVAVEMVESCMVTPSEATPQHALWLSNLDLAYRSYTPIIFLYRRPSNASPAFSSGVLKAALSRALVPYYPLAGRLTPHRAGRRPEIHCTGEGVLFVTARADATLANIGRPAPSEALRRVFVPSAGEHAGILTMFQVTLFKCGGVCLGTAVHHMAADGAAFSTFLHNWAAIVRGAGEEAPVPPFLDRTLLRARSPPAVRFHHIEYFGRVSSANAQPNKIAFQTAILPVSIDQVKALKAAIIAAGNNNNNNASTTTFAAVVAHVWRCACISLPHQRLISRGTEEDTRLYVTADARSRIRPPLPTSYLGSAALRTSAVAKVGDVVSSPLGATASRIAAAVSTVNDEYVRSLLDFMEIGAKEGMRSQGWFDPETDLVVVSYFGVVSYSTLDFGWGCPTFFCRASSIANGYVHLVPCGDHINVVVAMEPGRLMRYKQLFYEGLDHFPSEAKRSKL